MFGKLCQHRALVTQPRRSPRFSAQPLPLSPSLSLVTCHLSPHPRSFITRPWPHPKSMLPLLPLSAATALLLSATGTVATHSPQARQHSELAQHLSSSASDSELEKHDMYTNVPVTWYPNDTGPDACTGKSHQNSDWQFGDGSACCGKQMRINANGKTAVATCVNSVHLILLTVPSPSNSHHHTSISARLVQHGARST
ncbi:hypothetical protein B0H13DRAFT_2120973 [Mycena leptocephala]|nr:hypothetical protein B0H13DRAFT_2120973 [Mycena leptocephala]